MDEVCIDIGHLSSMHMPSAVIGTSPWLLQIDSSGVVLCEVSPSRALYDPRPNLVYQRAATTCEEPVGFPPTPILPRVGLALVGDRTQRLWISAVGLQDPQWRRRRRRGPIPARRPDPGTRSRRSRGVLALLGNRGLPRPVSYRCGRDLDSRSTRRWQGRHNPSTGGGIPRLRKRHEQPDCRLRSRWDL